jgi:trigger factor
MPPPSTEAAGVLYEIQEDGPCQRTLTVQIPGALVDEESEHAARRLSRQVKLPGFRQGRVPTAHVLRRFAREVEEDVVEALASRLVGRYLEEHALRPVLSPHLAAHERTPEGELRLTVRFELHAPFPLAEYRELRATRPPVRVPEEIVDRNLEGMRQRQARLKTIEDRGAREGDDLLLDLEGTDVTGESAGQGFKRPGITLLLGTDDVHPDLSAALIGGKAGEEKRVRIAYPGDYRTGALAGRTIDYLLRIQEVREREIPALDDALAREVGDFEDLAALRAALRARLEAGAGHEAEEAVRQSFITQLLDRHPFEVPPGLLDREVDQRLRLLALEIAARGIDPERSLDWRAERERQLRLAKDDIRAGRILDAIAEREKIEVAPADLDAWCAAEATRTGKTAPAVRAALEREGRWDGLKLRLRRQRVLDFVASVGHIQDAGETA